MPCQLSTYATKRYMYPTFARKNIRVHTSPLHRTQIAVIKFHLSLIIFKKIIFGEYYWGGNHRPAAPCFDALEMEQ